MNNIMSEPQPGKIEATEIELPQIEITSDPDELSHTTATAGTEPPSPVDSQSRDRSVSFHKNTITLTHNASSESLSSMGKSSARHSQMMRRKSVYSIKEPVVCEKKSLSNLNKGQQFYAVTYDEVTSRLQSDVNNGLSVAEAKSRIRVFGENQIKREKGVSAIRLFLGHLFSVLNIVLLAAAIASIVISVIEKSFDWIEGALIFFILNGNTLIGFFQEYRSAKTMQSLLKMFAPQAEVSRGGHRIAVPAKSLVPGDIVHLEDGDFIPADLRLIEAVNFYVDEAFLTGESDPVAKTVLPLRPEEAQALGDRTNMAYMSSIVTGGRGKGIVVRTGEDTEIGSIAKKLRSSKKDKKTELQKSMKKLGLALFFAAIAFSFLVLAIQLLAVGTGALSERTTWLYIVALCVAFIPEGLPAILALTLAMGMRAMAKKNAIVRKLGVLESLNWVTDICSDKTGTLTEGKMVATNIWCNSKHYSVSGLGIIPEGQVTESPNGAVVQPSSLPEDDTLSLFFQACALCNMATLTKIGDEWQATSSPTEIAFQVLAHKVGMGKPQLSSHYHFLGEHPFDSSWKRMSVVYSKSGVPFDSATDDLQTVDAEDTILFMKGSVEGVLACCSHYSKNGEHFPLDEEKRKNIFKEVDRLASQGLRVLACAYKDNFSFSINDNRQKTDENSVFLGLAGIMDPPRPVSKPSVEKARQAGIDVYMLTGDHKKTAENIAKKVGIIRNDLFDTVMVGAQFEQQKMGGENLPKVIARCNPDTKIKMINELHSKGRFVIMTGDGVNDAPAIKMSDVGVAMGINGSEVTKDSADIVLIDDNFGTIINAIEEGRRIFSNINKIVLFLMTTNIAEVIVLVVGLCLSFAIPNYVVYPLTPMQILWLNVITDTPICMALGAEPVSSDAMKQPPKSRTEGLFSLEMVIDMLFFGLVIGTFALSNFAITFFTYPDRDASQIIYGASVQTSLYVARATCFYTLTYGMLLHGLTCLHRRHSIMLHKFKKKWIIFTIAFGALSLLITVYVPWINIHIFKHYTLGWVQWIQVVVAVTFYLIVSELYKFGKTLFISAYRSGQEASELAKKVSDAICSIDRKLGSPIDENVEEFGLV